MATRTYYRLEVRSGGFKDTGWQWSPVFDAEGQMVEMRDREKVIEEAKARLVRQPHLRLRVEPVQREDALEDI